MSSSGEEVDLKAVESEHEKVFHWDNEHVKKLVRYVQSQLTRVDDLLPFNSVIINWNEVEDEVGVDSAKCKHKWDLLLNSVRQYRTMPEIALEILSQNCRSEIVKYNKSQNTQTKQKTHGQQTLDGYLTNMTKKKKKTVNPAHPVRPKVNGYSIFCSKRMGDIVQSGKKGTSLMLQLGAMWKELSEKEKAVYNAECVKQKEEYLAKVKEYAKNHPDDEEIQQILAEETNKGKGSHQKSSKSKKKSEKVVSKEGSMDVTYETLSDTVSSLDNSSLLSPKISPKKKRHAEDSGLSEETSPTKKKKKAKGCTAEEVFVDLKFDTYKEEHPDLDDDEICSKLVRKFNKMSDDRKEKYKRKAEERNS